MKELVLLLSDWSDATPHEIQRRLKTGSDWYLIQKGAVQSYGEALFTGNFWTKIVSEWKRMHAMDVSDIYYDTMLANGQKESEFKDLKPGEKIKIRVINGSSVTYFWLQFAGGKMTVVANDGKDTEPVEADRMIIGVAETYDIILSIPDDMSYELRATSEDRTKFSSLWLGSGMKMPAPELQKLDYFAGMRMMNGMAAISGNIKKSAMAMSAQKMDMNEVMYPELKNTDAAPEMPVDEHDHDMAGMTADGDADENEIKTLKYTMLRSPDETVLPEGEWKELHFQLEGNMNRYVWSINNKVLSESDKILIKKGQNVRIFLRNNTMMRHPMHLHGHYFRVVNGQGAFAPLKNVLDIMPGETDVLEFAATESGDWFFHCHILYHMMSGMGRVFAYEDSPGNSLLGDPKKAYKKFLSDDKMIYPSAQAGIASNGTFGEIKLENTRNEASVEWHSGWAAKDKIATTAKLGRYFDKMQYLFPYVAWDYAYKPDHDDSRNTLMLGVAYTLPMLITADLQVDIEGRTSLNLKRKDIALTSRLRLEMEINTEMDYRFDLRYILTKYLSIAANYNSDAYVGAGILITY